MTRPRRRRADALFWCFVALCVLLVLGDAFYHKHGHFTWEERFGFFGLFGFVTFFLLVLAGKHLRKLLMRDEDYYDR